MDRNMQTHKRATTGGVTAANAASCSWRSCWRADCACCRRACRCSSARLVQVMAGIRDRDVLVGCVLLRCKRPWCSTSKHLSTRCVNAHTVRPDRAAKALLTALFAYRLRRYGSRPLSIKHRQHPDATVLWRSPLQVLVQGLESRAWSLQLIPLALLLLVHSGGGRRSRLPCFPTPSRCFAIARPLQFRLDHPTSNCFCLCRAEESCDCARCVCATASGSDQGGIPHCVQTECNLPRNLQGPHLLADNCQVGLPLLLCQEISEADAY